VLPEGGSNKETEMNWKPFCAGAMLAASVCVSAGAAYPERPITWVVPYTPGGVTDHTSRMLGKLMSDQLKQAIVIDNKPGAGGQLGTEAVSRAAPDGYTMIYGTQGTLATSPALYPSTVKYKPMEDFVAVHGMLESPTIMVTGANSRFKTIDELVAYAKENPGKVNMGSAGIGTGSHLAGELFQTAAGVDFTHVPYKGSGPALTDLRGGQIDVLFDYMVSSNPYFEAGTIRALAVTGPNSLKALPGVPTMKEAGFPDASTTSWAGIFVPAGTPADAIDKLAKAMAKALESDEVKKYADQFGSSPMTGLSKEDFSRFVESEMVRWKDVVKRANVQLE